MGSYFLKKPGTPWPPPHTGFNPENLTCSKRFFIELIIINCVKIQTGLSQLPVYSYTCEEKKKFGL